MQSVPLGRTRHSRPTGMTCGVRATAEIARIADDTLSIFLIGSFERNVGRHIRPGKHLTDSFFPLMCRIEVFAGSDCLRNYAGPYH